MERIGREMASDGVSRAFVGLLFLGDGFGLPGLFHGEKEGRFLFGCLDSGWRYPCRAAALDA